MITFLLFGRFQIQMSDGRVETITDTMAARVLAFLAYHNRFCSRLEIIRGCWGPHKLEGKEKLEDDAYNRQISNLRTIFTKTLGVDWEDYILIQPNGLQLRTETFTTDLSRLNDLLAVGLDVQRPAAERLARLRETYTLRRGYLLDGMHCDWVVSYDGGARVLVESRWDEIKRTIATLDEQPQNTSGGVAPTACYTGVDEWLPVLRDMIANATEEIILYGINFHIAIPTMRAILLDRLRAGVSVKILLLDPQGPWLSHMAQAIGNDEQELQSQGMASLNGLHGIRKKWDAEKSTLDADAASGTFEFRTFDSIIHGRIYAIDPAHDTGKLLLCPYVFGVSPSQLPCYLWQYSIQAPYNTYIRELRRLWGEPTNRDHIMITEA